MSAPDSGRAPTPKQHLPGRIITRLVALGTLMAGAVLLAGKPAFVDPHGPESGRGDPSTPPSKRAKRLGFEPHDMSARDMGLLVLGLGTSVAVVIGAMFLMLAFFQAGQNDDASLTGRQRARLEPPAPHLQVHPHAELRDERSREERLLYSYARIGPDRSRIPIERAITLTVGQSLDAGP